MHLLPVLREVVYSGINRLSANGERCIYQHLLYYGFLMEYLNLNTLAKYKKSKSLRWN